MGSFSREENIGELSPSQFLALADISMTDLGWDHSMIDDHHLQAITRMNLFTQGEKITVFVNGDTATIKSQSPAWKIFTQKRNERNADQLVEYIGLNKIIYSPEQLQIHIDDSKNNPASDITATKKLVLNNTRLYGTYGLILTNILVFVIMLMNGISFIKPTTFEIYKWGGNLRVYTFGGQPWRLITCMFLHIGIMHLVLNMYGLYFIGRYLERVIGSFRFVTVYLCTGIIGGLVSVIWSGSRITAGASGAIFGMYGVFFALLTTNLIKGKVRMALLQSIFIFIAYSLFGGLEKGIDNAAHLGGVISGFIFGYIFYAGFSVKKGNIISMAIIAAITVVFATYYLAGDKKDEATYLQLMQQLSIQEDKAFSIRLKAKFKNKETRVADLKNIAAPAWKECSRILKATTHLHIDDKNWSQHKEMMERYINERIVENGFLVAAIENENKETMNNVDSIRAILNDKVDSLRNWRTKK